MKTLTNRALLFGMALAVAAALVPPTASAASPNLFATVAGNGTLVHGNGVSSVTHIVGTGQYEVTFTSDVSSCAYVSTTHNAFSQAIQSFTAGSHLSSSGVYVEVKNQGGGLLDGPFDLAVACNTTGWHFAVVGYTANLVRSSPGATLNHLGVGRYDVNFTAGVGSCAYLATVGDPGNGLVFNPNGVYTGSGSSAASVYIETKNPGGGLSDGIPFHLAVVCPNAPSTEVLVVRGARRLALARLRLDQLVQRLDRQLRLRHEPEPGGLHDDRYSRLGQHERPLHPGHGRDHARPGCQHQRNPGPEPALLRRRSDQPGVPRRGNLLNSCSPFSRCSRPRPRAPSFFTLRKLCAPCCQCHSPRRTAKLKQPGICSSLVNESRGRRRV